MNFGYLLEFWDSITDAVVGSTTYTIEFFEQIGNAVAGAIGNIFWYPLHLLVDVFVWLSYLFAVLKAIFFLLISPLNFIYNFLVTFLNNVFADPISSTGFFDIQTVNFLHGLPFWFPLVYAIIGGLFLFLGYEILKHLKNF